MKLRLLLLSYLCIAMPVFSTIADFNDDKKVNLPDFAIFSKSWQTQEGEIDYNSNCDISAPFGQIDINDLLIITEGWLTGILTLDIYSDGWGHHCDTVCFEDEGNWTFQFTDPEPPYMVNTTHYAYASRGGYYTELYSVATTEVSSPHPPDFVYEYMSTLDVDLDPIEPNHVNGTLFLTQSFFKDSYLSNTSVQVYPSEFNPNMILEFITDGQGRFAINLSPGLYWIKFYEVPLDPETLHEHEFPVSGDYQDYAFMAYMQAFKPNIYIYPEVTTELTVQINFPEGGMVIESEPLYQNGWQVTVEPSGLIDDQYGYLFYESLQPDFGQYDSGWVVHQPDLEIFFRDNLTATGFNATEIQDFIDYWIPLLVDSPYYAIYPQYNEQLEKMIQLDFSQQPQNIIRLMYSIRGMQNNSVALPEPQIPEFCRHGFTVAEWGVILK